MLKKLIIIPILFILISGCSRYGFVSLNYPQDPMIYLPDHIQKIALVNRSLVKKEDRQHRVIESVATGEIAGSDRLASDECLKGVFDRINGYRGIIPIIPQKTRLYGSGTRETPELLDWKIVKDICDSSGSDALLVLETFDSNSDLLVKTVANQVVNVINGGTPKPSVPSQIRMNVYSFWRLYDPSTMKIIDQYQSTHYLTFNGVGTNYTLAPPEALPQTAYAAGQEYIERFLPSYYTVRRDMYKRGKGSAKRQFKAGFRRAEMANWQDALDIWKEIANNRRRKNAGRACLNIAVAYEVLGNTDKALEWAKKSYQDYNNKSGRDYAKVLIRRKELE